jgi:prophage antirepressor-like protein
MLEEIKTDNNCIVKAFENNPISIIEENVDNKRVYCFKANDIAKVLDILNIRQSIQNYDEDERVVRKVYDPYGTLQDTIFLTSRGVYRLLYSSKKEIAKKFRKWASSILDDIIFNESVELKRQLEEQKALLLEKDETIKQLENKPETYGFERLPGYIYFVEDTTKPGHIKLGYATTPNNRVSSLNVASSTYSLKILATFETFDKEFAEKIIHHSLNPFRIKNRKEWFYFKNENEIIYALNTVKNCIQFIKNFDINDVEDTNINLESLLIDINKVIIEKSNQIKNIQKENSKNTNKKILERIGPRSGTFKGACFVTEKNQWCAQLQHNYKNTFLGYFPDEIDAAKVYNDYAAYLNQKENTNFYLNDIPGYITVPRNVPEENKKEINEKKTSEYTGVSYDSKRKFYVAGIGLSGKTFNLGNNQEEVECAKLYNQQALFFNNTLNTKYKLNDIPNYTTIPKDFRSDIINNKKDKINKKSSEFYGVSITTTKKWAASYMLNKKKIHIGTFNTELEACKAYNKIVIDLNKNGCNYKINNTDTEKFIS